MYRYDDDDDRRGGGGRRVRVSKGRVHSSMGLRFCSYNYMKDCQTNRSPQAVFKIISFAKSSGSVGNMLFYVAKKDEDEYLLESSDGETFTDQEGVNKVYKEWQQDFKERKSAVRHATHMILSAKVENNSDNRNVLQQVAAEVTKQHFHEKGYKYVLTTHKHGKCPHIHVVVNNYNQEGKKKLKLNKPDLFALRRDFSNSLKERDLTHLATLKKDRPDLLEDFRLGRESLEKSYILYRKKQDSEKTEAFDFAKAQVLAKKKVERLQTWLSKEKKFSWSEKRKFKKDLSSIKEKFQANEKIEPLKKLNSVFLALSEKSNSVESLADEYVRELEDNNFFVFFKRKDKAAKILMRKKETLRAFANSLKQDVLAAQKYIKSAELPRQDKKKALGNLKNYCGALDKAFAHKGKEKISLLIDKRLVPLSAAHEKTIVRIPKEQFVLEYLDPVKNGIEELKQLETNLLKVRKGQSNTTQKRQLLKKEKELRNMLRVASKVSKGQRYKTKDLIKSYNEQIFKHQLKTQRNLKI